MVVAEFVSSKYYAQRIQGTSVMTDDQAGTARSPWESTVASTLVLIPH
jgi:hypothetical protein